MLEAKLPIFRVFKGWRFSVIINMEKLYRVLVKITSKLYTLIRVNSYNSLTPFPSYSVSSVVKSSQGVFPVEKRHTMY
jgi:hypothetical protein